MTFYKHDAGAYPQTDAGDCWALEEVSVLAADPHKILRGQEGLAELGPMPDIHCMSAGPQQQRAAQPQEADGLAFTASDPPVRPPMRPV